MTSRISSAVNIESELEHYKQISEQIRVLEAQKNNLKNSLVAIYFGKHDEYVDANGVVRATYKAQIRSVFDSAAFKNDHPKMYRDYSNDKEFHQFLVK